MLDDFFWRALLGGIGVALLAGPLGCFVVWRRMAYLGDSLAHGALLGVALGLVLGIDLTIGIVASSAALVAMLLLLQRQRHLAGDTLLVILAHGSLSLGLVAVSFMEGQRLDMMAFLFGDILAVNRTDLIWIYGGAAAILCVIAFLWRPLLAVTVHEELARAEGAVVPLRARAAVLAARVAAGGAAVVADVLRVPLAAVAAVRPERAHEPRAAEAAVVALAVVGVRVGKRTREC